MVSKRDKFNIILDILQACTEGASKTNIVYQANLNFRTVTAYLDLLTEKGMIEVVQESTTQYRTTQKGYKMMKELKNIKGELGTDREVASQHWDRA